MTTHKKKKKLAATAPTTKAVGVVSYTPHVFVVFGAYSSRPTEDQIFNFPRLDGKDFDLPAADKGKNYVMLLAPDRLAELQPYADRIHRLLVFGRPDEVVKLGLPIIDAVVKDGKITSSLTHRVDELRHKIETCAVDLPLQVVKPSRKAPPATSSKADPAASSKEMQEKRAVTPGKLLSQLRQIKQAFTGDADKVEFEDTIMIPTILRLVREVKRSEFARACAVVHKRYGVSNKLVKTFQTYIEEQAGSGSTLGRAARAYLWPKKAKRPDLTKLAKKHGCELSDLRLVVLSVQRLHEMVNA
jgi:hypothetical protein